jgi:predicted ATPase
MLGPLTAPLAALFPERSAAGGAAPEVPAERVFEVIGQAVHRLAGDGPLLLVLEDFHWADPTSCDLLHFLARRVPALPLLLVVTSRTEEIPAGHAVRRLLATLVRERIARELRLAPLGRDEVAEMMAAIAGGESISAYSVSRK